MFENYSRKDRLRRAMYDVRDKFGFEKIQSAAELLDKPVMKDVIGFGSINHFAKFNDSVDFLASRRKFVSQIGLGLAAVPFLSLIYGLAK